mmetsp:Transcript_49602/g.98727  ORF Transcript_49602/g.98727 Transcript_49602/m.98727 type:complete len:216 (+) Transcript_49602:1616-2263(+)
MASNSCARARTATCCWGRLAFGSGWRQKRRTHLSARWSSRLSRIRCLLCCCLVGSASTLAILHARGISSCVHADSRRAAHRGSALGRLATASATQSKRKRRSPRLTFSIIVTPLSGVSSRSCACRVSAPMRHRSRSTRRTSWVSQTHNCFRNLARRCSTLGSCKMPRRLCCAACRLQRQLSHASFWQTHTASSSGLRRLSTRSVRPSLRPMHLMI